MHLRCEFPRSKGPKESFWDSAKPYDWSKPKKETAAAEKVTPVASQPESIEKPLPATSQPEGVEKPLPATTEPAVPRDPSRVK